MQDDVDDEGKKTYPIRAYSYVRMSTHRQLRGDSLRRQLDRSKAFADEHNLLLDDSMQDLGISAWKGRNFKAGALGRFLAKVENGEIAKGSYLLIESLDRLSREAVPDALTLFMAIINSGIVIATLGREDRQIYSREVLNGDWTKLIIGLAVMSRGHEESQTKSERIGAANRRKRELARRGEGQITGLTPTWIDAKRLEGGRYEFSLNHHAATVREIYEMAGRGLGATAIARRLNTSGTLTFKSKRGWYQSIIKLVLKRQDVIGVFQPHHIVDGKRVPDGDPISGYFPTAVDKDLFWRVQLMRRLIGKPGRKGATFGNLFTGLCFCAHCHGPMGMKTSYVRSGRVQYLVCSNHARGYDCDDGRKNFRYDLLEAAVLNQVSELNLADFPSAQRIDIEITRLDEAIAELSIRVGEFHDRERRLALVVEEGGRDLEVIVELLKTRQAERQSIEVELRRAQSERLLAAARRADPTTTCDRIAELRLRWEAATDDEDRYTTRAEAHIAIRQVISLVTFDSVSNTATLIVGNGLSSYHFRDGIIEDRFRAYV
jgi:DNA invertase Pin-like site-specific DNA recombinase